MATSASTTFRLLFLVLFLAPAAVDAQWSVRRSADGTVSASAVAPDRVMGVLITCDPAGRSMMVGVGSYLLAARRSLSAVSDRNKPPPGGASGSDNGVKEAGHRGKD